MNEKLANDDVSVPKYCKQMLTMLERLHDVGTESDRAGNRKLFYDQVCTLVLLYFFNPLLTSLRSIQRASELKKVQRQLKCPRASLGSLSEALHTFDADLLLPVIQELSEQLQPLIRDKRLDEINKTIMLVDGSLLTALPQMAEASLLKEAKGNGTVKWRLHTQFELLKGVPERIDVTRDQGEGCDEREVLSNNLQPGICYIGDRGYMKYAMYNAIHDAGSSYVIRIKDNSKFRVLEERELTDAAREQRVVNDDIVLLSPQDSKRQPNHKTRLIVIEHQAHKKHHSYKKTGPACDGYIRIVTDMLDVPAEMIALLYHYRWAIEIFFRYFKHLLGCRHLISRNENGIRIEVYCGIIACLLISLWTGRKPTLRTHEMVSFYLMGWADEEELLNHLTSLKKHE